MVAHDALSHASHSGLGEIATQLEAIRFSVKSIRQEHMDTDLLHDLCGKFAAVEVMLSRAEAVHMVFGRCSK